MLLFLVASGVDVSCCALGVNCSTGGAFFGLRADIARSIETTFIIPSSSIVIVCKVMVVILNGPTAFASSFHQGSSAIRSAEVLSAGS